MRFVCLAFFCGIATSLYAQTHDASVEIQLENKSLTVAGDMAHIHSLQGTEKTGLGAELRINANFDKSPVQVPAADQTAVAPASPILEDYLLDSAANFVPSDPDLVQGIILLKGAIALQLAFGPTIRVWMQSPTGWHKAENGAWTTIPEPEETSLAIRVEGIDGSVATNDTVLEATVRSSSGAPVSDRVVMTVVKTEFMLSFDDGPVAPQTLMTLNALSGIYVTGKPVRCVFFMVGENGGRARFFDIWASRLTGIKSHPELARAVFDAGHYIGNHTAHHAGFVDGWTENDVIAEITGAETEIRNALGAERFNSLPRLFRSPYLQDLPCITSGVQKCGYQMIWGKANLGESNPFLRYADIKRLSREYLERWNTRENPVRRTMPTLLVYHELHNDIARNVQEIVAMLRNCGFVLHNFDPKLCYPNRSDY